MPRHVDRDRRRDELGDAVWRVVRRDGLAGATVRAVAAEAGTSVGALRHWFTTQSELLTFAMARVGDQVRARIGALDLSGDRWSAVLRLLAELVPVDAQRRAESEVWLAFVAQSQVDPALHALRDRTHEELGLACRAVLGGLADGGLLRADLDLDLEARRLHALLDGVVLHTLLSPGHLPPAEGLDLLERHLRGLAPERVSR
ncbi:TetR/AcrR family transcriptional regulator [Geodermatophilus sp. SYSU D00815]